MILSASNILIKLAKLTIVFPQNCSILASTQLFLNYSQFFTESQTDILFLNKKCIIKRVFSCKLKLCLLESDAEEIIYCFHKEFLAPGYV